MAHYQELLEKRQAEWGYKLRIIRVSFDEDIACLKIILTKNDEKRLSIIGKISLTAKKIQCNRSALHYDD
jgi:hypothetical protein